MSEAAERAPSSARRDDERLASLDVFRGITVAGMLLVNNPGSWSAIYSPLAHAEWHGWTPTDLIFPFFLFVAGVSLQLSGARRTPKTAKILRRGATIVLLGLALNAFPFYTWGRVDGFDDPTLWRRIIDRFEHLRFSGVLQRIGVVYIAASLLARRCTTRALVVIIGILLVGYWAALTIIPVPDSGVPGALLLDEPSRTLAAWTDRVILGPNHIWRAAKTWDPEGPLSTLPAIATALFGVLAGRAWQNSRALSEYVANLFVTGVVLTIAGLLWGVVFPINKNLWTSSYVIFTAGMAMLAFAACCWTVDGLRWRRALSWFEVFGTNPLLAFVGSGLMARLTDSLIRIELVSGKRVTLHTALFETLVSAGLDRHVASLLYAISFVLLWLAILWPLHRRGIFLRA